MAHSRDHGLAQGVWVRAGALAGRRWDPAHWLLPRPRLAERCSRPCVPLGRLVAHITYGPIRPGERPVSVPDGVAIVGQKAVRPTGVLLSQTVRVAEGSAYDLPRCRLQPQDLVLCRSGAGSLGRRRFTVFDQPAKATVSCFVDLIRLRGVSPYYVATVLRSSLGWPQIQRLINGVGTPNLSFAEIRSLSIPAPTPAEQDAVEADWAPVRQAHQAGNLAAAEQRLDEAVARLEERLVDA